jgi:hypothetical protein
MAYLPAELKANLTSLDDQLSKLEQHLQPILQYDTLTDLNSQLSTEDMVKLNTAIAYSLQALYYIMMRVQGKDLSDHPVLSEIERIKKCVERVKDTLASQPSTTPPQPQPRIDSAAAARVIVANTGREMKGSTPLPQAGHLKWREELDKVIGRRKI